MSKKIYTQAQMDAEINSLVEMNMRHWKGLQSIIRQKNAYIEELGGDTSRTYFSNPELAKALGFPGS